jgi:hypothetical protein
LDLILECGGSDRTHFLRLVIIIQVVTKKAPVIDQTSGISLNSHNCQTNAKAISVAARTTLTGPACSNCKDRVNRIWPQNENIPNSVINDHSNRVLGIEKPSNSVVIIIVSVIATQPKLNIIIEWWTPYFKQNN